LTLDAKASDLRVDFRFPEGSGAKEKLSAKAKALEDNFAARVAEAADKAVLTTLMSPTRCRQFLGSPQRSNDLVVRIDQLCSNGRYVYVNFSVENAQRADISLLTAQLTSQSGATSVETRGDAEVPVVLFEKTALSFRETTRGVAAIPIVDPNVPPATYTLTVQEDGGGERVAVVEGIASSGGCSSTAAGSPVLLAALLKLWRRRRMGNR
jgi:hypothetical protein